MYMYEIAYISRSTRAASHPSNCAARARTSDLRAPVRTPSRCRSNKARIVFSLVKLGNDGKTYAKTLYSPVCTNSFNVEVAITLQAEVGLIQCEARAAPFSREQTKANAPIREKWVKQARVYRHMQRRTLLTQAVVGRGICPVDAVRAC